MPNDHIFSYSFEIQSHHITENSEVSLPYLLGCMQHTAEAHVNHLHIGWEEMHTKGYFWAIYRMGLQIHQIPRKYDHIIIRTWANQPHGLLQDRYFEVVSPKGAILLQALSVWIILDNISFKPQTITEIVNVPDYYCDLQPIKLNLKVPYFQINEDFPCITRDVLYSDLDPNHHVNNTNYVKWVIDSYPGVFLREHQLKEMYINYTLQARLGDRYRIFKQEIDPYLHRCYILHGNKKEEFCKFTLRWEKR